ncbi:MAG: tetratricopeptide repeat protein [Pseudomonadota bacterium]
MNHTTVMRALALTLVLGACAGPKTYQEGVSLLDQGKVEQGLAKMEEAVRQDPGNNEYRIGLISRRARIVNGLNNRGEQMRVTGNLDEAQKLFAQALALDPGNINAQQSQAALVMDRRHKLIIADADTAYSREGVGGAARALEQVRLVLQERPNHREALLLKNRVNDELTRAKGGSGRLAAAYRKPVTLEFRDAPVRSVFDFLGKVAGLNFAFDRDVDPNMRTTISVRDTSIEDAIALVLTANQLEQSVTSERSVMIYPNTPQKVKDYQQLLVRSFMLANADPKTVAFSLKTLLKAKDVITDDRLGIIMMRDTPEMIRMAERIIALQDVADSEVMLEVEVLEVKRSRLLELGIRWPDSATLSLAGSGAGVPLTLQDLRGINRGNINIGLGDVTINANKTDADSNILANPRIRVRNKEKAKILIGDKVPVITVTTNGVNGGTADSVTYVDVGLKLDVEPNIYLDDEVAIKIGLEVSNVVKQITSRTGTQAYQIGTRSANTVLRLKDGETQVLAGLINDEDRSSANKVPGIGELPLLNRLFGTGSNDTLRSEIVLSITPHVVRSVHRPELSSAQFESGTEASVGGHGSVASGSVASGGAAPGAPAEAPAPVRSPMTGGDDTPMQPSAPDATPKDPAKDAPKDTPPGDKGPGAEAPKKGA